MAKGKRSQGPKGQLPSHIEPDRDTKPQALSTGWLAYLGAWDHVASGPGCATTSLTGWSGGLGLVCSGLSLYLLLGPLASGLAEALVVWKPASWAGDAAPWGLP